MPFVISPEGKRVTATEEDAAAMVEHCGYKYETPPPPPAAPLPGTLGGPPAKDAPKAAEAKERHLKP